VTKASHSGRSFASRVAGSLLHAVDLQELVCEDVASYEALALSLATDAARSAVWPHVGAGRSWVAG